MGGFSRQRSKSNAYSFTVPGSAIEPYAAGQARGMVAPGYFDANIAKAVEGSEEAVTLARALAGGEGEEGLFRQARERIMSGLSARGLATSAPGVMGEYRASEEVFNRRMQANQLLQQASQGLAMIRMLPEEMRAKIMAMLLGQTWSAGQNVSKSAGSAGYGGMGSAKTKD